MNVLSLFDGMSCGMIALERAGIKVDNYYASEIKKVAIKVSSLNYPQIIHIGDVRKIHYKNGILFTEFGEYQVFINILVGGSPCQDFTSIKVTDLSRKGYGLEGDKSSLFYEYLRIKKEIEEHNSNLLFLLENVKMKKDSEKELNDYLKVDGIHINSSLLSFQNRPRIYWTNIPKVEIPNDKNISFQTYKEYENLEKYKLKKSKLHDRYWMNGNGNNSAFGGCRNVTNLNKIQCLTRKQDRSPNSGLVEYDNYCRFLTQTELEAAQTVPAGYTRSISYNQAQDLLGDGWTVDVIAHIFSYLPEEYKVR